MALTFRTGSGGKGSALTIDELDNNFRHFTGSHDVSGSFEVTGSIVLTGSLDIAGAINSTGNIIAGGRFGASGKIIGLDTLSATAGDFSSHITASGNISASGDLEIRNITASAAISASGTLTADTITFGNFVNFTNDNFRISGDSTSNAIFSGGIKAAQNITASGNISSSANVSGLSGSFTALILTAPNGNQFKFTTDNSGLLSITGSAV